MPNKPTRSRADKRQQENKGIGGGGADKYIYNEYL